VTWVRELPAGGYRIDATSGATWFGKRKRSFTTRNVIIAGGVLGTVPLLLKLKASPEGLPRLSEGVGAFGRTNSEALIGVTTRADRDLSEGIAITSVLHTDEHSHLEPVRYAKGSGFFRLLMAPHVPGESAPVRLLRVLAALTRNPIRILGSPTTAHILGGACMGASAEDGVIDHRHRVFGYDGLYVIDGSAISSNPGVNPALTITALAERAMSFIPPASRWSDRR